MHARDSKIVNRDILKSRPHPQVKLAVSPSKINSAHLNRNLIIALSNSIIIVFI